LALLDLEGALVTIDAIACQKKIAQEDRSWRGRLCVDSQGEPEHLLEDIQQTVGQGLGRGLAGRAVRTHTTREVRPRPPGRTLVRGGRARQGHPRPQGWAHLTTVGMCRRTRTVKAQTSEAVGYFHSAAGDGGAGVYAQALRGHWGIENQIALSNWMLVFHEERQFASKIGTGRPISALLRKNGVTFGLSSIRRKTDFAANANRGPGH